MKTVRERKNGAVVVMRWSARVLGLIFAGFLLLMFIGESLESGLPFKSIEPFAAVGLALMGIYTISMLLAFKWECLGSCLGGIALGGFFVILFLGLLPGNVAGGFSSRGVCSSLAACRAWALDGIRVQIEAGFSEFSQGILVVCSRKLRKIRTDWGDEDR
ncbi:MAG: hypothetical protein Q8O14_03640, partial [bacterium]|nr:hypothetical protein [bacterium]